MIDKSMAVPSAPVECPVCKGTGWAVHDEEPPAADFLDEMQALLPASLGVSERYALGASLVQFFCEHGWTPPMASAPRPVQEGR